MNGRFLLLCFARFTSNGVLNSTELIMQSDVLVDCLLAAALGSSGEFEGRRKEEIKAKPVGKSTL